MAKFSQSRHGSFERNIFLRYLSKLSDIWHFTICKIRRENCDDARLIRRQNFPSSQCKQLMNMHEICPNMSNSSPTVQGILRWSLSVQILYEVHELQSRQSQPIFILGNLCNSPSYLITYPLSRAISFEVQFQQSQPMHGNLCDGPSYFITYPLSRAISFKLQSQKSQPIFM